MDPHTGNGAELGLILMVLGGLLMLGLLATMISRRIPIPRVTVLVLLGLLLSPHTFGILPTQSLDWFPLVADMTLALIGFLLGEHLTYRQLKVYGKTVLAASLGETTVTAIIVFTATFLAGLPTHIALLLGAIATATAPAATVAVVDDVGTNGPFTETLLEVVAIDDAWGILIFSMALAFAGSIAGGGAELADLTRGLKEIGLSVAIGAGIGFPLVYLSEKIRNEELALAETLGMAFLGAGVALWLDVSFLLASVVMGVVVANIAKHKERPFHAIHQIIFPFTSVFFLLAGASFSPNTLASIGVLGSVYLVARAIGKSAGGALGAFLGGMAPQKAKWFGVALLPQAGVALGMALIAANRYPDYEQQIYGIVITATIFFEIVGPMATRLALQHTDGVNDPATG